MRWLTLALLLALALAPSAAAGPPTLSELESELVCPTCGTTLEQSHAPVAERMRAFILRRIAAGDSKEEIKAKLVSQFGPGVLASPPKEGFDLAAWLLPLAGLGLAVVAVGFAAWRWSRAREVTTEPTRASVAPQLERRLDEELARFDG